VNSSIRCLWVVALCISLAGVAGAQPPGAAERVVSPEVLPDKRVTFRLRAPDASDVVVNGNWPGGEEVAMSKDADGIWSVTTGPLPAAIWSYAFSVDGLTLLDPGNTPLRRNSLLVPGAQTALLQPADVPHGTVAAVWYPSPVTNADRRMLVYTPPGYEDSDERYPVMYLYHGGGGNEENWSEIGLAQVIMDNLIAQDRVEPMIIVMPNANWDDAAAPDAAPSAGGAADAPLRVGQDYAKAEDDIVNGEIRYIESHYRALTGRENRAIAGLSMGGGIAINVGLRRLDQFAWVGQFSTGMFGGVAGYDPFDVDSISPGFLDDPAATNEKLEVLYFSCGTEDMRMPFQMAAAEALERDGIVLTFKSFPGDHEWSVWRSSLADFAGMIFR
jgi:enterochelin esterase-like enzyme